MTSGLEASRDNEIFRVSFNQVSKDELSNNTGLSAHTETSDEIIKVTNEEKDDNPNVELIYLQENVFPILLPLLKKMLLIARKMKCLKQQKSIFNGVDYISELLWNLNPQFPERKESYTQILFTPWVQDWLQENPRPYLPLSWIWTKEYAAIKLQSFVRGFLVRIQPEVQEMRLFWKAIKMEQTIDNYEECPEKHYPSFEKLRKD